MRIVHLTNFRPANSTGRISNKMDFSASLDNDSLL